MKIISIKGNKMENKMERIVFRATVEQKEKLKEHVPERMQSMVFRAMLDVFLKRPEKYLRKIIGLSNLDGENEE